MKRRTVVKSDGVVSANNSDLFDNMKERLRRSPISTEADDSHSIVRDDLSARGEYLQFCYIFPNHSLHNSSPRTSNNGSRCGRTRALSLTHKMQSSTVFAPASSEAGIQRAKLHRKLQRWDTAADA